MNKQYHILNGDALKSLFPKEIDGEIIVFRECLVDGDVVGNTPEDFFRTRAKFISKNYEEQTVKDYYEKVVPEFEKMQSVVEDADINLWFEDDLFCQVNFWFAINFLKDKTNPIYLVRPPKHSQYSFGRLNKSQLISIYRKKLHLEKINELSKLWKFYRDNDTENLLKIAEKLKKHYPFVLSAVKVHIERLPKAGYLGRPKESLIQIVKELKTGQFGPVFIEFCRRESIYGFGDLQVKRLLEEMRRNSELL